MRNPARPYRPGGEHFGEQLRGPQIGHKMIRDLYTFPSRSQNRKPNRADFSDKAWEDEACRYRDEEHTRHSDAYLLVQREMNQPPGSRTAFSEGASCWTSPIVRRMDCPYAEVNDRSSTWDSPSS